ncbi:alpha-mannosidase [Microcoleus sp. FACHB-1515]|uniref:alpha-mannosidase n=1 Tax=Cyanophyceae TaxID=3028117 RepID=UPI0016872B7D|nr:alpha-mannosidase [Microcoleus sp. FACHB-1515]MBD2091375.1 alpha-mannosidase [Microcoleus sp. FACHB-1515]
MLDSAPASASSAAIDTAIDRLRHLSQLDLQTAWYCNEAIAPLNDRGHIAWDAGAIELRQTIVIPERLNGYAIAGMTLRLGLLWWAEAAEILVNGNVVQAGDLFDCSTRILLSESAKPREAIDITLRLTAPAHDRGALVKSYCCYESIDFPEPSFIADELISLQHLPDRHLELERAIEAIDWSALPNRALFDASLAKMREQLQPLSSELKARQIYLLGHAHLDLAWLWPIAETWDVAERTFRSVLQLQQEFPDLIFGHSSPALYAWIEQHRPDLFAEIQAQIASGCWEVIAGLWVEPEFNTVCGESIARQVIYGQRYVQEKFGRTSAIAWLPDSFGFCWQLPQILQQGAIEYFVTQKLRWNDTTEFPHDLFWWEGRDGTRILSYSSVPIGEGIDPAKMAKYASEWEAKTDRSIALWLPGIGDHGGGPTRDMLTVADRWANSPFFPKLKFATAEAFLQQITQKSDDLPIWQRDLYLEFHRGCYTTHADQKLANRRSEILLYQAELWSAVASLTKGSEALTNNFDYPAEAIESAWKLILFNQFHDILPGSAIPEVYEETAPTWQQAQTQAAAIRDQALAAIAAQIDLPEPPQPAARPLVIFNSLNWTRSQVVSVALPAGWSAADVYDDRGRSIPVQISGNSVLFYATDLPSVGYRLFWLAEAALEPESAVVPGWTLENDRLRVQVSPLTGNLNSVYDKQNDREILSAPGNQLQAFRDCGQYWDAWNIDPHYADHPLPPAKTLSTLWIDRGAIRQRLRVQRLVGSSRLQQDYVLDCDSEVLRIETVADWQEEHTLLKAAFPLTVESDFATCEIPFGAIDRPTRPQTPAEAAQWEIPALQWADLSQADYGVSLLNDCKYGYDVQPNQLRLTLLRSSRWPDPHADRGHHEFCYALYPHRDRWSQAHTVQRGYELNQPPIVHFPKAATAPTLPPTCEFLNLSAPNLICSAFKRSHVNPQQWILRCYEACGQNAAIALSGYLKLQLCDRTNLLEEVIEIEIEEVKAWAIATVAVALENDATSKSGV